MSDVALVLRPEAGMAALVDVGGRVVRAANALHVRVPPGSTVLVSKTPSGYVIIGRRR